SLPLASGRLVRVALSSGVPAIELGATGTWLLTDEAGNVLLRAAESDRWRVEGRSGAIQALRGDVVTAARPGPLTARPDQPADYILVNGKRYRGEVVLYVRHDGLLVTNRLHIEDYLRGVVPLEIGRRVSGEEAAVAAQAVAARSYTYVRLASGASRPYDVVATVQDQVYGGADAETLIADGAVWATRGLVLTYEGRMVNAPYHSTCGGSTAEVSEVWYRSRDEPYLRRVSDRIGDSERYYCDPSPRFRWSKTLERSILASALDRYLAQYAQIRGTRVGVVRGLEIDSRTPSGRVRALVVRTDRDRYLLRGNDVRFVMRAPNGEILNSTYFSVRTERDGQGRVARATFEGGGYGHGIGMCQWGAIGRARVGQDFRAILSTYYPGTAIASVD
ncbi:MAG: SpoIID/LytB domain-containing protein, partial [Gemmatimonadota bacterium]|nr:SpoIID/LytB domain-containing protein [Gemmatimonadota bacterium]